MTMTGHEIGKARVAVVIAAIDAESTVRSTCTDT